ncbi:polysaccharide biosynthesis C-terminal domain-containing protein [Saprospiraceae bacterium]|nr:polysaccharide biosynthesis C-terminal domain-containing protein [Saprospiraceae bacterium]
MGIIKRQSIKSSIVNFFGAAIGALATLFVYPLDLEIYGFAQFLYSTATLLIPLGTLGVLSIIVRYYPKFNTKDSNNYNGFLSLVLMALSTAFSIFLIFWFLFNDLFLSLFDKIKMDASKLADNQIYILVLLAFLILLNFVTYQSANKLRIVVPNIIQTLGFKIFLPLWVLAFVYLGISETQFAYGVVAFFGVASLLILVYLKLIDAIKFGKIQKPTKDFSYKEMAKYSMFGSFNQLSNGIALRIDSFMVTMFIGFGANGIYNIALFIANVLEIPTKSIYQISGPIISKAWEENDTEEISVIYKKASANLFLFGSFVFLGIWYLLDDLIKLSSNPDGFTNVKMIFLLLGIGKLTDMVTSVNSQILIFSKLYKYNLLFLIVLAVSNLILNYIFIPKYGIIGAALATTISLILYNVIKVIFIFKAFKMHPFSFSGLKVLFILIPMTFVTYLLPIELRPIISILVKGTFVTLIFLPIAYFWNISEDANELVRSTINKITKFK